MDKLKKLSNVDLIVNPQNCLSELLMIRHVPEERGLFLAAYYYFLKKLFQKLICWNLQDFFPFQVTNCISHIFKIKYILTFQSPGVISAGQPGFNDNYLLENLQC